MDLTEQAREADIILNSTVFNTAFDNVIENSIGTWERSQDAEKDVREAAYFKVKAIREVRRELIKILNAKRMKEN